MKTLVTYHTQTGNTRKIAEAIYDEIPGEKELKPLAELEELEGYDIVFYGFPIQAGKPAKEAGEFLAAKGAGKRIALFVTHGAPEGAERVGPWLENARDLVERAGAELLGLFDCQGQAAQEIVDFLRKHEDPEFRRYGREAAEARGLPDEERLRRARAFAREIMKNA